MIGYKKHSYHFFFGVKYLCV